MEVDQGNHVTGPNEDPLNLNGTADQQAKRRLVLKPEKELSLDDINENYPEAARFIENLKHLKNQGFKLIHADHIKHSIIKYWKMSTYGEVDFLFSGTDQCSLGCPFTACDQWSDRQTIMKHTRDYHGPEKWMCPYGLCRHVVPVIALRESTISTHI